jgi:hypothetical protein
MLFPLLVQLLTVMTCPKRRPPPTRQLQASRCAPEIDHDVPCSTWKERSTSSRLHIEPLLASSDRPSVGGDRLPAWGPGLLLEGADHTRCDPRGPERRRYERRLSVTRGPAGVIQRQVGCLACYPHAFVGLLESPGSIFSPRSRWQPMIAGVIVMLASSADG